MSLEELISRLEKCTGPDRELDGRIWCAINGYEFLGWDGAGCRYRAKSTGHIDESHIKKWTRSIDTALTLVPEGWSWHVGLNETGAHAQAVLGRSYPTNKVITQEASKPAIALSLAALRAHAALEQGER